MQKISLQERPSGHDSRQSALETCRECGGTVKVIACIEDQAVIAKILSHLQGKDTSDQRVCRRKAGHRLPTCLADLIRFFTSFQWQCPKGQNQGCRLA